MKKFTVNQAPVFGHVTYAYNWEGTKIPKISHAVFDVMSLLSCPSDHNCIRDAPAAAPVVYREPKNCRATGWQMDFKHFPLIESKSANSERTRGWSVKPQQISLIVPFKGMSWHFGKCASFRCLPGRQIDISFISQYSEEILVEGIFSISTCSLA